jgi:formamidopyrimidine-DNA glycosylase
MPELPEVETTLRGIQAHLVRQRIVEVVVREPRLRWPIESAVSKAEGQLCTHLGRRGKYLLIHLEHGGLLVHLGMSGSLRILTDAQPPGKHDHYDICLQGDARLRFNDPRRFGALLWVENEFTDHPLLRDLGPEPLSGAFNAEYLHQRSRGRKVAVKNFIMNGHVVVGVGNIYASEALFMAGIHPRRAAGRVSRQRYDALTDAIRDVLERAIRLGGTTLQDFSASDGSPGYFAQELLVYGRAGHACFQCGGTVRNITIGQRSSFYCPACQR